LAYSSHRALIFQHSTVAAAGNAFRTVILREGDTVRISYADSTISIISEPATVWSLVAESVTTACPNGQSGADSIAELALTSDITIWKLRFSNH
jgi:hypothetical protein